MLHLCAKIFDRFKTSKTKKLYLSSAASFPACSGRRPVVQGDSRGRDRGLQRPDPPAAHVSRTGVSGSLSRLPPSPGSSLGVPRPGGSQAAALRGHPLTLSARAPCCAHPECLKALAASGPLRLDAALQQPPGVPYCYSRSTEARKVTAGFLLATQASAVSHPCEAGRARHTGQRGARPHPGPLHTAPPQRPECEGAPAATPPLHSTTVSKDRLRPASLPQVFSSTAPPSTLGRRISVLTATGPTLL